MSAELRLADAHAEAAAADRAALVSDLGVDLSEDAPDSVREAFLALADGVLYGGARVPCGAALCGFIEALYGNRDALGRERFDRLLGRIRQDLRRGIDRRMEIAA